MLQTPLKAAHAAEPIAGYRLRDRIGAGGYGEVWSAEAPGELVKAIKFVFGQMDETRAAREFKSLNLIKGVRHPFLLSLERIEVVDGQLLIVTELADGSLKDEFEQCVKKGQPGIPRRELLAHLADAADALDYMNSQHSLQHLDVKPENLLLVGGRIKVADFGLVKDIQETTCSMMGGLTPIYAPPEVFDARPSRWSDQYSLAIVFQEMLTGVLPFPGKTAAQLAAQHLSAKPRLSALPGHDQPIIARALAKDPGQRFASCKEMVSALLHAEARAGAILTAASVDEGTPQGSGGSGSSAQTGLATAVPGEKAKRPAAEDAMLGRLESAERAASLAAQGDEERAEQVALTAARGGEGVKSEPAGVLVDLPPPSTGAGSSGLRPILFLGVGGLAGTTLQRLRRRIEDRCDEATRALFSFLLMDTDSRELMEATHGQVGSPLHADETLALPLRKSADYRNDSRKYLDWLSRRWLFNIPRSQQTEGIRPFGRLALVDHGEQVMTRLSAAIAHVVQAGSRASQSAPGPQAIAPRVILVGSTTGGACSGMILDLAFAARQILDERAPSATVELLLLHGTGRQPAAQELAAVNTYALLTELNHYLRLGGVYPGEAACGLKSRSASAPAVDHAYLGHLGKDLTADGFLEGCDRVAEFLYLETASAATEHLAACRAPSAARQAGHNFSLRSFGLCQIGFSRELVSRGTTSLCRAVIGRWSGEARQEQNPAVPTIRRLTDLTAPSSAGGSTATGTDRDAQAAVQAKELGIDLDGLMQRLVLLASEELGGQPDAFFQRIVHEAAAPGAAQSPEKWLSNASGLFGVRSADRVDPFASSPLHMALSRRLPQVIAPLGEKLRNWLLALPEDPAARVHAAQRCVKWFQGYLKDLGEKAKQARDQIGGQLDMLEQRLFQGPRANSKGAGKDLPSAEALFLQHCQLRLYQLSAHLVTQVAHGLAGFVTQASDNLHDLARDVKYLASQFAADAAPASRGDDWDELGQEQLRQDEQTSAARIDEHFQQALFARRGFRETILQGGEARMELLAQLKQEARREVVASLQKIDLCSAIIRRDERSGGDSSRLAELIAAAQPWLQQAGGERRLLCLAPQGQTELTASTLADLVGSDVFSEQAAIITSPASQVVFCFELGSVPLSHAAASLIDHCPQYAEAASRLHVRSDVSWHELRGRSN